MLRKEILRNDPTIEMEELGDVVQSYINKILFLRVCEDRNIETYQSLYQIADHHSHQELIAKFKVADSRYNSGLFEEKLSDGIIGNVSSSFWTIIRELYFPQSPYSFAVLYCLRGATCRTFAFVHLNDFLLFSNACKCSVYKASRYMPFCNLTYRSLITPSAQPSSAKIS